MVEKELVTGLFTLGGAVIGVIGGFVASGYFRERKRLTALVGSQSPLVFADSAVGAQLMVTYDGVPIENLYDQEIIFTNTGNRSIDVGSISVFYPGADRIFSPSLPQRLPPSRAFTTDIDGPAKQVRITGDFLNPGESVRISVLVSGEPDDCQINYRQKDVRLIIRQANIGDDPVDYVLDALPNTFAGVAMKLLVNAFIK